MNTEKFESIVARRQELIEKVLRQKGQEYASDIDRLHNFKKAAAVNGITPERALWGFATKHLVSVIDIIDGLDSEKIPTPELVDEKIGDMINYLILLEVVIRERYDGT